MAQQSPKDSNASQTGILRIGTRGSPLALWQANEVKARLHAAHPELADDEIEIAVIETRGDKSQAANVPLAEAGGKGLWVEEFEDALLAGEISIAVHSMKDMPTALPDGLIIGAVLERADPRDAFISRVAASLDALPRGAVIGTTSLRRQAQISYFRPDLKTCVFRGNVGTRLRKLDEGQADATLLAVAGLTRLGAEAEITEILGADIMLSAVAQGIIGIEVNRDDAKVRRLMSAISDDDTYQVMIAERAMLAGLDGSCKTPIAGLARLEGNGSMTLRGRVIAPDGSAMHEVERSATGPAADLGAEVAAELKTMAGDDFFDSLK